MGSASVNSLYRFYISSGTQYTIASTSTLLRYDASGTATTIAQGLTDGKRFQFVTYKDKMIAGNGYDNTLKWDGVTTTTADTTACRTAGDSCAELGAPFATLITGTAITASKWYQYKVAFYDGTTYSYSTARSNPIATGATVYSVRLTDIPLGPAGTTHRYIYRSQANNDRTACLADTTYKMVKDIADNSTQAWTDIVAMGAEPNSPTWATVAAGNNCTPPKSAILEICSERLFASGNTTAGYQSDVYWSDDANPDYFSPSAIIMVRPDDGDKVTFLKTFLGILTIGKTNTIQKFYTEGSPLTDWSLSNAFSFVGCPAPYTAAVTPLGIFYLGRHGLYRFSGQASELISDAVTKEIEDISQVNIADCTGIYWNNEYHLAYASSASSSATNNRVLVYDIVRNAYVLDTKNVNCFAAFGSGTDYGTLFSGSSTSDGYVFAHSPTTYTFLKRYKSEIDSGTFSSSITSGTEDNPILSILTLDNMESYTSNALARATWISSETTASKKVPPDLGSGVDGAKVVSADETLTGGSYNYTSLTIDAGKTLILGKGTTVKCLGTITVNGKVYCGGILNIYAHTITIGASGSLVGGLTLRANTINNGGLISGDACLASTMAGNAPATMIDNDFSTVAQSGGGALTTATFPAITDITTARYRSSGSAYGAQDTAGTIVSLDGNILYQTNVNNNSFDTGAATNTTGWTNVSAMGVFQQTYGTGVSYGYEMQAFITTPVIDYLNGSIGTIRPTPAAAATTDYVYALDVFSESTIKNESNYSLKIVVPPGADTLNENITKTITDTDLSALTYILLDVYASRSGTHMQLGLGEGSLTDFVDIPITAANTWETVKVDISGIANANIDHCTRMGIKFTNTDVGNVVYIDNIKPALTTAAWTSPIYQINAESLKKLYWNENLNTYGDVTWAIRTNSLNLMNGTVDQAATADAGASVVFRTTVPHGMVTGAKVTVAGTTDYNHNFTVTDVSDTTHFKVTHAYVSDQSGTWEKTWTTTEYTNPNGSDISGETANTYIQFRTTLTTSDTTNYLYPWLYSTDGYVFKINYSKIGANYETSVSSKWVTGWRNLGNPASKKLIKRIIVDYEGESENLIVNIKGMDNAVDRSFTIDMSVLPDDDITDKITGTPNHKRFTWDSPINSSNDQALISDNFMFTITHEGNQPYRINRMSCIISDQELY